VSAVVVELVTVQLEVPTQEAPSEFFGHRFIVVSLDPADVVLSIKAVDG
jgi:hypothetical protein